MEGEMRGEKKYWPQTHTDKRLRERKGGKRRDGARFFNLPPRHGEKMDREKTIPRTYQL